MNEENIWISKVGQIMNNYDKDNPTIGSLLYMLNSMTKEYEEYKEIGTVEEFRKLKAESDKQPKLKE